MKIALVHEFLNQLGGAERVLENFLEIWPDAIVHVLLYDAKKTENKFEQYKKKVSFLNSWPLAHTHHRLLLALMPFAIEHFNFNDFDLVVSDSSSFAKGLRTNKLHICYCHTPTRFLWTDQDYLEKQNYPWILKALGKPYLNRLRRWDYKAAQGPKFFIANSINVQNRIKKYYNRESVVIQPPVNIQKFYPDGGKRDYFFAAGRLEPYKKTDLVVQAFKKLGLTLKVVGSGSNLSKLKASASKNIEFLGRVSDDDLRKLYSGARAFIFPQEEDAGIMPVEAMACGTPVIAYGKGGVLETVEEGVTGTFFYEPTAESLREAIIQFDTRPYYSKKLRQHALQYEKQIFQKKVKEFVEEKYRKFKLEV